jgi:hypothetical protein
MNKRILDTVLDIYIYDDVISEIILEDFDSYDYATDLIENYWGPYSMRKYETLEDKKEYLYITKEILNQLIDLYENYEELIENYKEENSLGGDSDEDSDFEDTEAEEKSILYSQRIDELIEHVRHEYKHAIVLVDYHDKPDCLIPGYLVE